MGGADSLFAAGLGDRMGGACLLDGPAPKKRGLTGRGDTPGALKEAKGLCGPFALGGDAAAKLRDLSEGSVGWDGREMADGEEGRYEERETKGASSRGISGFLSLSELWPEEAEGEK